MQNPLHHFMALYFVRLSWDLPKDGGITATWLASLDNLEVEKFDADYKHWLQVRARCASPVIASSHNFICSMTPDDDGRRSLL